MPFIVMGEQREKSAHSHEIYYTILSEKVKTRLRDPASRAKTLAKL